MKNFSKSVYWALTLVVLIASSFKGNCQSGTNTETRVINTSYKTVCVATGIRLSISGGSDNRVLVTASNQSLRNKIKTTVVNDTLKVSLSYKDDPNWKGLVNSKETLNVQISAGNIASIEASEAASVTIKDQLAVNQLSLTLVTGAQLYANINCKMLNAEIQDGSNLILKGEAVTGNFHVKGGSIFDGKKLMLESCSARVYSGSESYLFVTKKLNIVAKNDARVYLTGNPTDITKDIEKSYLRSNGK